MMLQRFVMLNAASLNSYSSYKVNTNEANTFNN
jgi:hypothetical protein